jgi:hypothetical protein
MRGTATTSRQSSTTRYPIRFKKSFLSIIFQSCWPFGHLTLLLPREQRGCLPPEAQIVCKSAIGQHILGVNGRSACSDQVNICSFLMFLCEKILAYCVIVKYTTNCTEIEGLGRWYDCFSQALVSAANGCFADIAMCPNRPRDRHSRSGHPTQTARPARQPLRRPAGPRRCRTPGLSCRGSRSGRLGR